MKAPSEKLFVIQEGSSDEDDEAQQQAAVPSQETTKLFSPIPMADSPPASFFLYETNTPPASLDQSPVENPSLFKRKERLLRQGAIASPSSPSAFKRVFSPLTGDNVSSSPLKIHPIIRAPQEQSSSWKTPSNKKLTVALVPTTSAQSQLQTARTPRSTRAKAAISYALPDLKSKLRQGVFVCLSVFAYYTC